MICDVSKPYTGDTVSILLKNGQWSDDDDTAKTPVVCVRACLPACVCVRARAGVCVCACVRACVRVCARARACVYVISTRTDIEIVVD